MCVCVCVVLMVDIIMASYHVTGVYPIYRKFYIDFNQVHRHSKNSGSFAGIPILVFVRLKLFVYEN